MVYLERGKNKQGYTYWCAVEKKRIDGKVKRVWSLYLGSAQKIAKVMGQSKELPVNLKSFQYGKNAALLDVNQDLNFVEIVDKHAKLERRHGLTVGEYMLLLIMGRCDKPLSRNAMEKWFKNSSMSLLWKFKHKLNSQNFLNHMKRLYKTRKKVDDDLAKVLIKKGLAPSILMWDRTNFYNYIEKGETLPRKGHCKHHRNDKNLIDLGLVVSEQNIPFLHTVHEANMHDAKSFPKMLDELVARLTKLHLNSEDLVLVFDKGNNSEPNIKKVMESMRIVGSVRPEQAKDLMDIPLSKYTHLYENKKKHKIIGYRVKRELFGMRFTVLITFNESTKKRQFATYERNKKQILEKLSDLKRRVETPKKKGRKRTRESIEQEVNDIIRKNMRAVIKHTVKQKKKGYTIDYRVDKDSEKYRLDGFGKNILFTDKHKWSSKRISRTYNSKYLVEDDFKWFNDTALISMKPFFSRLDHSITAHVFLCVMGMLFYRYLFWKLRSFKFTGEQILEELKGIRLCISKPKGSGPTKAKLMFEQMSPLQTRILSFLNLQRFLD